MSNERILDSVVARDHVWQEAAEAVLSWDFEASERVEHYGRMIANAVVCGQVDIGDLRTKIGELNLLDREVVELSEQNGSSLVFEETDLVEVMARRLCHGAARYGLDQVRSKRRLQLYTMDYRRKQRQLEERRGDLCCAEYNSLGLEILVLGNYAGKLEENDRNT